MTILENLAFAELALLHASPQSTSTWVALEHLRRAREQLVAAERPAIAAFAGRHTH